ncbi:MAG: TIGR04283 family arsenosugar biosynthesis glycosyltransferase [Thermodesulfobacteriota bacterium]
MPALPVKISVVIPVLNEVASIGPIVAGLAPEAEVVVVDGGSSDGTAREARASGAVVVETAAGRGLQMDAGAERSTGEVILFLHADTRLPPGWRKAVAGALEDEKTVGGAFRLSIASPGVGFRVIESVANVRAALFGLIYGDQAIFARRDAFFRAGGFRKLPLMEDVDCVKRLSGEGKVRLLDERVLTSPRKWRGERGGRGARGLVVNTIRNWFIIILYTMGVSPETLYRLYYGDTPETRGGRGGRGGGRR